ncbi:MAG: hypothetical protein WAO19_11080 [Candidatus Kryptoniota bacterium]
MMTAAPVTLVISRLSLNISPPTSYTRNIDVRFTANTNASVNHNIVF